MHAVKALYYVCKLFGLAPFKLRMEHITRKVIFVTKLGENVFYSLWSLFLLILMILGGIMRINAIIKGISEGAKLVTAFALLFSYVSSITSLIIVNLKRDLAPVILKELYNIDGDLLEYENQVRESKRSQYAFMSRICILLFPALLAMPLSFVYSVKIFGPFYLILLWTSSLINLMLFILVLGFMSYLHHKLAILNLAILSVFKIRPKSLSLVHKNVKHAVSSSVRRYVSRSDNTQEHHISVMNTNYSGILLFVSSLNQNPVSSKILSLRSTYNRIYDFLEIVSSIYGFPILVQLAQKFGACWCLLRLYCVTKYG
jgi:hypothetical protein